jgi:hypothetical protein
LGAGEAFIQAYYYFLGDKKECFSMGDRLTYSGTDKASLKETWILDFGANYTYVFAPEQKTFCFLSYEVALGI